MNTIKYPDYVAIQKPGENYYTWYDRNRFPRMKPPPLTEEQKKLCGEMTFTGSGKFITREDGEVAEIWEQLNEAIA